MAFIIILVVVALFLILKVAKTLTKIRDLRERGVNISNKNNYYKLLSFLFLRNLPS